MQYLEEFQLRKYLGRSVLKSKFMLKSSKKSLCPVCESKNTEYRSKYRYKSLHFQNLSRHLCLDCGLQFAFPMPERKILDNYNRSYHNKAHGGLNRNKIENAFFTGIAKTRIKFIKENIKFNFSRKNESFRSRSWSGCVFRKMD